MAVVGKTNVLTSDPRSEPTSVDLPALVPGCSQDVIAPREVGAFAPAAIPGSVLATPDSGGSCARLDAAGATARAIADCVGAAC